MEANIENKKWLFQQLENFIKLNDQTKQFYQDSKNSLLPEMEKWIEESKQSIEQNCGMIDIIKNQLLRNFKTLLSPEELSFLNSL